jgi:hypothetical protein
MATQKQIEANRRNAQRSTGPKTEEGREIVSCNAITHGLTAARAVALPEEQEEFDRFAEAQRQEWYLEGALERYLCDRMIHCAWRLKRATCMETSVLFALCQKGGAVPSKEDPALLGRVYIEGHGMLTNLTRYERQIERSLREAQRELELACYARAMQTSPFYVRNLKKFPAPGDNPRPEQGPFNRRAAVRSACLNPPSFVE